MVPTISEELFDSTERFTQSFVWMPRSNVVLPKKPSRTALRNDWLEDIVEGRKSGKKEKTISKI